MMAIALAPPGNPGSTHMPHALPRPKTAMIRRIEAYLDEKTPSKRPRDLAPSVLAVLIELHLRGQPYPGRHAMAAHLGSHIDSIDAVTITAKARGMLSVEIRLVEGMSNKRETTRQEKHLVPSGELLAVATGETRR